MTGKLADISQMLTPSSAKKQVVVGHGVFVCVGDYTIKYSIIVYRK